jgi:predicted phosphodiesterase
MKLIATADLHYNIRRSRASTEKLADRVADADADALLLVGDTAGRDKDVFEKCLALFSGFKGRKLFVAGNHGLWSANGEDAMSILRDELPARAANHGFESLEFQPVIIDGVGLVGTVGWYDYSFRNRELGLPMRFYERKVSPGAARYFSEHNDLLEPEDDLSEAHREMTVRWMDGVHVKLGMSDADFAALLADKLAGQLDAVAGEADRIIAAVHHLPFANMLPHLPDAPKWRFIEAYMGSERLGEVLLAEPKVTHVICGHTHQPARTRNGHIECINVGSNYHHKRLVEIEV